MSELDVTTEGMVTEEWIKLDDLCVTSGKLMGSMKSGDVGCMFGLLDEIRSMVKKLKRTVGKQDVSAAKAIVAVLEKEADLFAELSGDMCILAESMATRIAEIETIVGVVEVAGDGSVS